MRTETDFLGKKELPEDALYGIHALRAKENFPDATPFFIEWYKAIGYVKLACYQTYKDFSVALQAKYPGKNLSVRMLELEIVEKMSETAMEIIKGYYFEHFIVPAMSGGAGTSINMNVNEIIANATLIKINKKLGEYFVVDPIEHANVYQSTNDVIPTSLKVAVLFMLTELEGYINSSRGSIEALENLHRNDLRTGYTQMQSAVPTSFGKLFSTYSEAFSRDWWRVSKCFERIKVVNLGGSAVGTGMAIPRFFIIEVAQNLQKLTGLPVTRSENMSDATSNLDSFVEIHAIMKSHAVNLEKMASDLRLLASDILGQNEISIPAKQVGSSIMPGKVNPVIPEFIISAAHKIYANDQLITSLCAQGCLELNAYLPVIGHALLDSLHLLISCNKTLKSNLLDGLMVHADTGLKKLYLNPAITTALCPFIGYHKASLLAKEMKIFSVDIFEANKKLQIMEEEKMILVLKPENILKLGYSINDII